VTAHAARATLATLHDAIASFRDHEIVAASSGQREAWAAARGAIHLALAARGSRLALYDAVDSIRSAAAPLPPGFLEAVRSLGDASCLESLARAWAAAPRGSPWRAQVETAARDLVRRLKLGGRNAMLKEVRAAWPGFV
jgi:hypothetical protein